MIFSGQTSFKNIEKELSACMKKNPSTYGTNQCIFHARKKWDMLLNKIYKNLLKILPAKIKYDLKQSQIRWLRFYNYEKAFLRSMYYPSRGSMYRTALNLALMNLKKARVLQLADYFAMNNE